MRFRLGDLRHLLNSRATTVDSALNNYTEITKTLTYLKELKDTVVFIESQLKLRLKENKDATKQKN